MDEDELKIASGRLCQKLGARKLYIGQALAVHTSCQLRI